MEMEAAYPSFFNQESIDFDTRGAEQVYLANPRSFSRPKYDNENSVHWIMHAALTDDQITNREKRRLNPQRVSNYGIISPIVALICYSAFCLYIVRRSNGS
jgi:hypothetical protein